MAKRVIRGILPLANYGVDGFSNDYPVIYQEHGKVITVGTSRNTPDRSPFGRRFKDLDLDSHLVYDELAEARVVLESAPNSGKVRGTLFFEGKDGRQGSAGSVQKDTTKEVVSSFSFLGFMARRK